MDIFAKRIRSRTKQLGLSLAQAARRADVPERSFAHYAAQRSEPDLATLVRIAQALGGSVDYLLGIEGEAGGDATDTAHQLRERIRAASLQLDEHALMFADSVLSPLIELELERGR